MKLFRWLLSIAAALVILPILLVLLILAFPGWDERDHQNLDTNGALRLASREQLRVARKRGQTGSDEQLLGRPCLVSRSESEKSKHYVFEFRRDGLEPAVMSVYVDSAPDQFEANLTANAEKWPDGTPRWSDPVRNCGQ